MDQTIARARDAADMPFIHMDRSVGDAAQLLAQTGAGVLMVVDGRSADATLVGLLAERDIFRALATRGAEVYGHCVWEITEHDFPEVDLTASPDARIRVFCDRKVDHIALMDGFRVKAILNIWDCVGHAGTVRR